MDVPSSWPSTQATLLERLRQVPEGPEWEAFVRIYSPLIYRFCRRRNLQAADAQDISQTVFLAVQAGISKFEYAPERGKFRGWLGTLVIREIGRYRKKQQRSSNQGIGGDGPSPVENASQTDGAWVTDFNSYILKLALERIQSEFPPDVWRAFTAVWLEGIKPPEIAAQLEHPPAWVYRAKYNVLQRLKQEVLFLAEDIPSFSKP